MSKNKKEKLPVLQFRAQFSGSSLERKDNLIQVVASTGHKGLRETYFGNYYEELSLDPKHVDLRMLKSGRAKFLAAHDMRNLDSVIGVVESAELTPENIISDIRFSEDEISQRHLSKVRAGILTDVSIGYIVRTYEDVSKEGDKIPTLRATDYEIVEISLVPSGFDPGAVVRGVEETQLNEVQIISRTQNNIETETEILSSSEINAEDSAEESITMPPEIKPDVIDTEALKKEAATQERQRATEIRQAVRSAKLEDTLADSLIERGVSADEARKEVLAQMAKQPAPAAAVDATSRVEVGTDDKEKKRDAAVESILFRADSKNFKLSQGNPFYGMTLLRLAEEFQGGRKGMSDSQIATRAMSSSDLPYILANSAEKMALSRYQIQPRTWSRWAKAETLRNFKTKDLLRSGDFSSLEERQEGAEFKRGSFGESREQVTLKEWGKVMSFTRRMLINDDLGEVMKVAAEGGVAASRLENRLVYAILTGNPTMADNVALFDAAHANLLSAAALTDSTIGEAFRKMREQSSVDGLDKLNLAPKYLICGPSEEVTARKYLAQISPTQASNVNVFSSSLELIVDAEISTNDYFFAADQNQIDTVTLFRLEGEESPRIESRTDFETESVEIKVAHSAVAKAVDHRGMCKSANAS